MKRIIFSLLLICPESELHSFDCTHMRQKQIHQSYIFPVRRRHPTNAALRDPAHGSETSSERGCNWPGYVSVQQTEGLVCWPPRIIQEEFGEKAELADISRLHKQAQQRAAGDKEAGDDLWIGSRVEESAIRKECFTLSLSVWWKNPVTSFIRTAC